MALIDELRRKFPEFNDYSDAELVQAAAPAFGGSIDRAMRYFGVEQNEPGFKSSFKSALAATPVGIGRIMEDAGMESAGRGLRRWGERVQLENPSSVNSFSEFAESPWQGFKEMAGSAVGSTLPALIPYVGPAGRALGGLRAAGAATAIMAPQSYGEIRSEQDRNGAQNIPLAVGGSLAIGAIEQLGGVQSLLRSGGKSLVQEFAKSPLRTAGVTGLKTSLGEGGEEILQQPIQQGAGGTNPFTPESLGQTAFAGFSGAVGSIPFGILGGARRGLQHRGFNQDFDAAVAENAARMQAGESVDLMGPQIPEGLLASRQQQLQDWQRLQEIGFDNNELPGVGRVINPFDVGGRVSQLRRGEDTGVDVPQFGLFGGAGDASSFSGAMGDATPWVGGNTLQQNSLPPVTDYESAVAFTQMAQQQGWPVIEGSPLHQRLLEADQYIRSVEGDYQAPVANRRQISESAEVSQQATAPEVELTPLGQARKVFAEAGGKRGDWAKMLDGTDDDINVLAQKIEARVNNPKTSSESAKRWAAVLDTIRPKEQTDGQVLGQQQGADQPGGAAREGVPAQALQLSQPGGQAVQLGADGGSGGPVDVQAERQGQVTLAQAVGGFSQKEKQYWGLRMGLGAVPEEAADAQIAAQMGVSRQRVGQLRANSQKKVAKTLGLTVAQVQGDLQSLAGGRVAPPDQKNDPVARLTEVQDVERRKKPGEALGVLEATGPNASMTVIDSPKQTRVMEDARTAQDTREANKVLKANEGVAEVQTAEEQARDAQMEAQRQERAAAERAKLVVEMLTHPEAKNAAVDWNDAKSDNAPAWDDLTPLGQAKLVADYLELAQDGAPWKDFEAMFRDFERQIGVEDVRGQETVAAKPAEPGRVGVSTQAQSTLGGEPRAPEQLRAPEAPQRAEGPAPQPENQAAAGEGVKPLSEITVKITAVDMDTGREVVMDEKADVALREVDEQLAKARSLLECLAS